MKEKGFALTELIVVISIMAILMAIGGLAYNSWMNKYKVESLIVEMHADLMNTRMSSLSRGRTFFINFNAASGATQYTIYEDTNENSALDTTTDRKVAQKSVSSTYSMATTTGTTIAILQNGTILNTGQISAGINYGSAYDCILVEAARIMVGKMSGGACSAK